jgi:hypothetical protein
MDTSLALPVVHVEAQDRRLRSVRARTSVPPTQHAPTTSSLAALHKHLLHVYHFDDALRYICIYVYVIRLDPGDWHDGASGSCHHRSARVSGLDPGDWHDGVSRSRHHRSARVSGLDPGDRHDGRFSASVPPVWHAGSARDRPWFTPAERQHYAALLAAVEIGKAEGIERPPTNCDAPPLGCEKARLERNDQKWSYNHQKRKRCARFAGKSHPA